jgi:hypothetical protein
MPDGLLLLAFALTLVANAVLIVVAMRAMRPGGRMSDEPVRRAPDPVRAPVSARSAPSAGGAPAVPPPESPPAAPPPESPTPGVPPSGRPASVEAAELDPQAQPSGARLTIEPPAAPAPKRRSRTKAASKVKPPMAATGKGGRRRRFSLPPLDEDHEKVNRSIETFLSGGDAPADPSADLGTVSGGSHAVESDDQLPTTVAIVAVTGGSGDRSRLGRDDLGVGRPATVALAAVERSLRTAARGTDRVEQLGAGRFRIVLTGTGELAARAYLRRVRATADPTLQDLDPPRHLAVATATVLGEPVDRAGEIAERRLDALLEASRMHERTEDRKPRAAGD